MDTEERKRFKISAFTVLFILAAIGARCWIYFGLLGQSPTSEHIGEFTGQVLMGALFFPGLIAWVAWLVCGRSNFMGNLIFCIVAGTIVLFTFNTANRARAAAAGSLRIQKTSDELMVKAKAAIKDPNAMQSYIDQADHAADTMVNETGKMGGQDKLAGEAMQVVAKQSITRMKDYSTALQKLLQAGSVSPKGLNSLDDITRRRALFQLFEQSNQDMTAYAKKAVDLLQDELKSKKVDDVYAAKVIRDYSSGLNLPLVLEIRKCDDEMAANGIKVLDLYEKEWGAWQIDAQGAIHFANSAAIDEYKGYITAFREAASKQTALQQEYLQKADK